MRSVVAALQPKIVPSSWSGPTTSASRPSNTYDTALAPPRAGLRAAAAFIVAHSEVASSSRICIAPAAPGPGLRPQPGRPARRAEAGPRSDRWSTRRSEVPRDAAGYAERLGELLDVSRANQIDPVLVTQPALFGESVDPADRRGSRDGAGERPRQRIARVAGARALQRGDPPRGRAGTRRAHRSGARAPEGFAVLLRLPALHQRRRGASGHHRERASRVSGAPRADVSDGSRTAGTARVSAASLERVLVFVPRNASIRSPLFRVYFAFGYSESFAAPPRLARCSSGRSSRMFVVFSSASTRR